ncbi:hypothetical protein SDC9_93929 [bioreactor metagenome]|uniref:FeoB-associated Cys-rich membrane protein n=1 Tax=bioreactor metagenome TaxID=1076179 RepID=A0A645A4N9_9ZZZZ
MRYLIYAAVAALVVSSVLCLWRNIRRQLRGECDGCCGTCSKECSSRSASPPGSCSDAQHEKNKPGGGSNINTHSEKDAPK